MQREYCSCCGRPLQEWETGPSCEACGEHNNGRRGDMSGGKRDGAGRKPGPYGCKVTLAVRVSPDIKEYLAQTGNMSDASERAIRFSKPFIEWLKDQRLRELGDVLTRLHNKGGNK